MTSWAIQIPYCDPDERLAGGALIDLPARLNDPDATSVTRNIMFSAFMDGASTVGDVIDRVEAADNTQRRAMLDAARQKAGLPTIEEVEDAARWEADRPKVVGYMHGLPITFRDARGGRPR